MIKLSKYLIPGLSLCLFACSQPSSPQYDDILADTDFSIQVPEELIISQQAIKNWIDARDMPNPDKDFTAHIEDFIANGLGANYWQIEDAASGTVVAKGQQGEWQVDEVRITGLEAFDERGFKFHSLELHNVKSELGLEIGYLKIIPPKSDAFWDYLYDYAAELYAGNFETFNILILLDTGFGNLVAEDFKLSILDSEISFDLIGWKTNDEDQTLSIRGDNLGYYDEGRRELNTVDHLSMTDFQLEELEIWREYFSNIGQNLGNPAFIDPFKTDFKSFSVKNLVVESYHTNRESIGGFNIWTDFQEDEIEQKFVVIEDYTNRDVSDEILFLGFRDASGYRVVSESIENEDDRENYEGKFSFLSQAQLDHDNDVWTESVSIRLKDMYDLYSSFVVHDYGRMMRESESHQLEKSTVSAVEFKLADRGYFETVRKGLKKHNVDVEDWEDYSLVGSVLRPRAASEAPQSEMKSKLVKAVDDLYDYSRTISLVGQSDIPINMPGKGGSYLEFAEKLNLQVMD